MLQHPILRKSTIDAITMGMAAAAPEPRKSTVKQYLPAAEMLLLSTRDLRHQPCRCSPKEEHMPPKGKHATSACHVTIEALL